jgi:hypothetical protein
MTLSPAPPTDSPNADAPVVAAPKTSPPVAADVALNDTAAAIGTLPARHAKRFSSIPWGNDAIDVARNLR